MWYVKLYQRTQGIPANAVQADAKDTENFDVDFTGEVPTDSYVEGPKLSQTDQEQFAGWSYIRPVEGLGDAGGSIVQGNAFDQR